MLLENPACQKLKFNPSEVISEKSDLTTVFLPSAALST